MLPAEFRLKDKKEFSETFRKGKSLFGSHLLLRHKNAGDAVAKIGFSVGLKFSKKAVERNKVKRWLREAVRENLDKIKPGAKIVFILNPKTEVQELSLDILRQEVQNLLKESKLI
jgi:ribonuclease P protein component